MAETVFFYFFKILESLNQAKEVLAKEESNQLFFLQITSSSCWKMFNVDLG